MCLYHRLVVVAASLKSVELTDRVLAHASEDAFVSYNPGSSEFNDPDTLRSLMLGHRPDLLALNDEELVQLLEATKDANLFELAAEANRYARNVLCTLGRKEFSSPTIIKSFTIQPPSFRTTPLSTPLEQVIARTPSRSTVCSPEKMAMPS